LRVRDDDDVCLHGGRVTDPEAKGGGPEKLPKPRAAARMIASLAKQKAWTDSLTDEQREQISRKLIDSLPACESPREIASVVKAIASLEKNDLDRTRLLMEAEAIEDGTMDDATRLRADLDAIDRLEGRRAD
jgi:hypothetical protein